MNKKIFLFFAFVMLFTMSFFGCGRNDADGDIPEEYRDLIFNDYREFIENVLSDNYEDYMNNRVPHLWAEMGFDVFRGIENPTKASYGFCIKDLNSDGTDELILLREDYFVLGIFTIKEGEPVLLGSFWYKHRGTILDTGEIYVFSWGGMDYYEYEVKKLASDSCELITVKKFGKDEKDSWFIEENGEKRVSSKNEFDDLIEVYPSIFSNQKERLESSGIVFKTVFE